jgi:uncharacterized protein YbbC (DUF1343 family)
VISEGRGTDHPFQIFGHPALPKNLYQFMPMPNGGAKTGKYFYKTCYGWYISGSNEAMLEKMGNKIQLQYLIEAYRLFPGKDSFFLKNNFFDKLAGSDLLRQQIKNGIPEAAIQKSWEPQLEAFKKIRKKYLLYTDFE